MKLRTSFNKQEITDLLEDALEKKSKVTLWQSGSKEKQSEGVLSVVTDTSVCIELNLSTIQTNFNANETLFVHCDHYDLLFKVQKYNLLGNEIDFKRPWEVKLKDQRRNSRYYYKYQDFKHISFFVIDSSGTEKVEKKFGAVLVDISTSGVSFIVGSEDNEYLDVGCDLFVTGITDQKLPSPHKSRLGYKVPYIINKKFSKEKTGLVKVGVEFLEDLESINYKSIANVIGKKEKSQAGLNVNTFNGLDPDDLERTIRIIGHDNEKLARALLDNIDFLERVRFLTLDMKREFFAESNPDVLATALRLSTKELIYELLVDLTESMREDFLYRLDVKKAPNAILQAQDEIRAFICQKERSGDFILDPTSFQTYV